MKGDVVNIMANPKSLKTWRDNHKTIKEKQGIITQYLKDGAPKNAKLIKELKKEIKELSAINDAIVEAEVGKMDNLSGEWTDTYMKAWTKARELELKAREIQKSDLTRKQKDKELKKLKLQFNNVNLRMQLMKDPKVFGEKFTGFWNSTKESDIKRRNEILNEAATNLANGAGMFTEAGKGKKIDNPTDKQIEND